MDTRRVARRIAKILFRHGCSNKADRLVLETPGGGNGGGWGFFAVVHQIDEELKKEVMRVAKKGKPKPAVKRPMPKKQPWV